MMALLTIYRYPKKYIAFALPAMALFRLPLWRNKKISFYKLMGTGKNGSFDIHPDWQQWAIFTVHNDNCKLEEGYTGWKQLYGNFIARWLGRLQCDVLTLKLTPLQSHGTWDGKQIFAGFPRQELAAGKPIAVLTRASIRPAALRSFWKNVPAVSEQLHAAKGLLYSVGIGEMPLMKQATFSIWENQELMKAFAYNRQQHKDVIKKTRTEKWYSEEMFTRFAIQQTTGSLPGFALPKSFS